MVLRLLIIALLLTLVGPLAIAQPSLSELKSVRARQGLTLVDRAKKIATENNLPYEFTDPKTGSSYLLVANDNGDWHYIATLNDGAAITTGAAALQNTSLGFGLTGKGMMCGVWDDGIVKSHTELGSRILSTEGTSEQSHATHVTGTILAAGSNLAAKGMAPQAEAFTYYFDNDIAEMASRVTTDDKGLLLSNHSYGTVTGWSRRNGIWSWSGNPQISPDEDYRHGFYGDKAKSLDQLAFMAPYYTIVWAAGNDRAEAGDGSRPPDCNKGTGYDCIIQDAVAKNIITVGAVNKVLSYASPASVVMSNFSSWGPTDDGRIKPDVVGAGVGIFSLSAAGTNTYASSNGTSMSTPNVTGSLLLLQELYGKLHAGKRMKASTLKALAIHTAREAGAKPGPDYQFGWGLLNAEEAAQLLLRSNDGDTRVLERTLVNGESYQLDIVPQANKKITVTICWTDPEGNPVSPVLDPQNRMLVNDLDIRLIDEAGLVTFPWILNPTTPQAQATQGDNVRDNVEKIELEAPLQKKYTVLIRHKGNLEYGKQDYSIVLTYTPLQNNTKTFYWIGESGEWHNGANWSLSQKGAPAGLVPGENDVVIFDAGALQDNDVVALTQPASCERLIWLCDKQSSLNSNGQSLRIGRQLTISSSNMRMLGEGILRFNTASQGCMDVIGANFGSVEMLFESGDWTVQGSLKSEKISLNSGNHNWSGCTITADEISLGTPSSWDISQAKLEVKKLNLSTQGFAFQSKRSLIKVADAASEINWKNHSYEGRVEIAPQAILSMLGNGKVTSVIAQGSMSVSGNIALDTLTMTPGSQLKLSDNQVLQIKQRLTVTSSQSEKVKIEATSKATLAVDYHEKICLDNIVVKNVDATGLALLNGETNSVIENSQGWLQLNCDDVLFPDFDALYTCQGGLTQFVDKSVGPVASWSWNFNDPASGENQNISVEQNPNHSFSEEKQYEIELTVSNAIQTAKYKKMLSITQNAIPANSIIEFSDSQLMSVSLANSYQWYLDRTPISGSTGRTLLMEGITGVYEVVTSHGGCNRLSLPYSITGLEKTVSDITISPNPASDFIQLNGKVIVFQKEALLLNNLGQNVGTVDITRPIDVQYLQPSVYLLRLKKPDGTFLTKKILVSR